MESPQTVKIMMICPQLTTGGAERQLLAFCGHLDRTRFSISVVYYQQAGPIVDKLHELQIPVIHLDRRRLGSVRLLWALRRAIRRYKPDVLDCRLPSAYRFGRLAALGCRVPAIVAEERTVRKGAWARRVFDRLLNPFTDCWIGNSQAVADHIERDLHFPTDRIHVIRNGIDTKSFAAAKPHPLLAALRAKGKRIVLNLGRLHEAKNQRLFLRVCASLKTDYPDLAFAICGDGELKADLTDEARRLGFGDQCLFMGYQTDVPSVLAGSDLLIQTSHYEGMPNVVAEAMCAGVPVVATDAGGTSEVVTDGLDGFVVTNGDMQAIIARSRQILEDPVLAAELAGAARKKIQTRFSAEAMAAAYERVFSSLLGSR